MTAINNLLNVNVNVITVDTLPTDTTNLFAEQALDAGPYINDIWDTYYEEDNHLAQLPVASTSTTRCSIAQLGNTTRRRIVKYTIERLVPQGFWPLIPTPYSPDQNEVLKEAAIVLRNVTAEADGINLDWRIDGYYVYYVHDADPSKLKYRAGASPTLTLTYDQTEIPINQFVTGMTCPQTGGAINIQFGNIKG
jgi:hypothetical protein